MVRIIKNRALLKKVTDLKLRSLSGARLVSLTDYRSLKEELHKPSILIVDENEVQIQFLRNLLEQKGFRTLTAQDGLELSSTIETQIVDLILMNDQLPWVDGFQLCQILKEDILYKKIPVVMMIPKEQGKYLNKVEESGGDGWVTKPLMKDEVLKMVRKLTVKHTPELS